MMGKLLAERVDLAIFETVGSKHLYWSDYHYTEAVRQVFPNHNILVHGDYFSTVIVTLKTDEIKRRITLAVANLV